MLRSMAVALLVSAAPALLAQEPPARVALQACAPQIYAARLAAVLPRVLGRPVSVFALEQQPSLPDAALWLVDEWTLARWATQDRLAAAPAPLFLPFAIDHVLVTNAEPVLPRRPTWEQIALAPDLHDRLAIVDPTVDGAPWAAMMRSLAQRGQALEEVLRLWQTLDARAGRTFFSYSELAAKLQSGEVRAVVWPRGAALRTPDLQAAQFASRAIADSMARLGVAVPAAASPAWSQVLTDLDAAALLEIATEVGVDLAAVGVPPLPTDIATDLWHAFEQDIRSRGRATEELADWVELVFAVASLALLLLVWRHLRR